MSPSSGTLALAPISKSEFFAHKRSKLDNVASLHSGREALALQPI